MVGLALFVGTFYDISLRHKRNKSDSEEITAAKEKSVELKSYTPKDGHVYATSDGTPKRNPYQSDRILNGHGTVKGNISTDLENKGAMLSPPAENMKVSNLKSMFN